MPAIKRHNKFTVKLASICYDAVASTLWKNKGPQLTPEAALALCDDAGWRLPDRMRAKFLKHCDKTFQIQSLKRQIRDLDRSIDLIKFRLFILRTRFLDHLSPHRRHVLTITNQCRLPREEAKREMLRYRVKRLERIKI